MPPANVVAAGSALPLALGVGEGTALEAALTTDGSVGDVQAIARSSRIIAQNLGRPTR